MEQKRINYYRVGQDLRDYADLLDKLSAIQARVSSTPTTTMIKVKEQIDTLVELLLSQDKDYSDNELCSEVAMDSPKCHSGDDNWKECI